MRRREFLSLVPAGAGILLAACSSDSATGGGGGGPPPPPPPPPPPVPGANVTVQIGDNFFEDPQGRTNGNASVTINAGQTVGWRHDGAIQHTVTSTGVPQGAAAFDSGLLDPGDTFMVTLNTVGTYTYRCDEHPNEMLGATIIVQ